MIYNNILEAIGHTPLIKLNHMVKEGSADILVKFEGLNVGGSIKTRTAYNMIKHAEREGKINKDTINRWAEEGWEWSKPISHKEYLEAKGGELKLGLTPCS